MNFPLRDKFEKAVNILLGKEKQEAEVRFWRNEIKRYLKWYNGEIPELYGNSTPTNKIYNIKKEIAAILTFFEVHQKRKYLKDLLLEPNSLIGSKVLDVGSGPFPNALCFSECEVYSLDPLHHRYLEAGFPIHCYDQRARFVHAFAEDIPFDDHFFDAIVSVNAIDHVDDFKKTALEIKRVSKPTVKFRMHVHYHPKTTAEPLELNDDVFLENYSWVKNIKKLNESRQKTGSIVTNEKELYVIWGN
jgi:ubiquinone/menaquinone biosynthesis C-methylase UbiE